MTDDARFSPHRSHLLDDDSRLAMLDEPTVARLLALRGDEDVADLGSGTGFWADRVASWTTGTVYAVELQGELQEKHLAKGPPPNVRPVLGDIDGLPLPPLSIDRAFSISVFHEAHGAEGLERLAAALRPGGLLVVVDWRRAEEAAEHGPRLQFRFTKEEASEMLAPYLEPLSAEDLNDLFFAVVAQRATV